VTTAEAPAGTVIRSPGSGIRAYSSKAWRSGYGFDRNIFGRNVPPAITLEQVADATKICPYHLKAMEADRFDLPVGSFLHRSFLRQ
jgi:hypothetical protein